MAKKQFINFNKAILLLFIIAVIAIIKAALAPQPYGLEQEANIVLAKLTDGNEINLLNSNELVEEKVRMLDRMDYGEIKSMLGIESDFCIYFEDTTGNIVRMDNINSGIGSDKIYVNGEPCK